MDEKKLDENYILNEISEYSNKNTLVKDSDNTNIHVGRKDLEPSIPYDTDFELKQEEPEKKQKRTIKKTPVKKGGKKVTEKENTISGYKYLYFISQKKTTGNDIPIKIGITNNFPEEKAKLQAGNTQELKSELIIEFPKMDADKTYKNLQKKYASKHINHDWYSIGREEVKKIGESLTSKDFKKVTEGRAKLTKTELKKMKQ